MRTEMVSTLVETQLPKHDVELRERIRDHAREHGERYSARLFDLWAVRKEALD